MLEENIPLWLCHDYYQNLSWHRICVHHSAVSIGSLFTQYYNADNNNSNNNNSLALFDIFHGTQDHFKH